MSSVDAPKSCLLHATPARKMSARFRCAPRRRAWAEREAADSMQRLRPKALRFQRMLAFATDLLLEDCSSRKRRMAGKSAGNLLATSPGFLHQPTVNGRFAANFSPLKTKGRDSFRTEIIILCGKNSQTVSSHSLSRIIA